MISNTLFIIVLILYNKYNLSLPVNVVLPFDRQLSSSTHTPTSLLSELTDTSAGVHVCIGDEPAQCLQLSLHMNEHATWLISSSSSQSQRKSHTKYNKAQSNTYKCVDPTLYYFSLLQYQNGYISQDTFTFTSSTTCGVTIPNYTFLLCEQYNYIDRNSGVLGLAINSNAHHFLSKANFLSQLNTHHNYTIPLQFSFEYNDYAVRSSAVSEGLSDISALAKGNVVIGSQLYKGRYVNDNILKSRNDMYIWGGHIRSVSFRSGGSGAVVVDEPFQYELAFEFGYVLVPGRVHVLMKELFFKRMKQSETCNEITFRTFYYGYVCDMNKEEEIIRRFPQMEIEFDYGNVVLHGKDVFVKDSATNMIVCLLVFPSEEYSSARWKLGAPFFKRQYMLFHYDNHTISYYTGNPSSDVTRMKWIILVYTSVLCTVWCVLMLFVFKLFIYKYK